MNANQCRAARALLGWTQGTLAEKANVSQSTVADFEREVRVPVPNNKRAIVNAFWRGGVRFAFGGVILR